MPWVVMGSYFINWMIRELGFSGSITFNDPRGSAPLIFAIIVIGSAISNLLGVRRESITQCVGLLHKDGIVKHSRGRITITDRKLLEKRVCECYAVVKKEFDRLLPDEVAI